MFVGRRPRFGNFGRKPVYLGRRGFINHNVLHSFFKSMVCDTNKSLSDVPKFYSSN